MRKEHFIMGSSNQGGCVGHEERMGRYEIRKKWDWHMF
jgi:hypothetical protein